MTGVRFRLRDPYAIAAGLLAVLVSLPMVFLGIDQMDETIYLSFARRMLDGQVMYRDFFTYAPPFVSWLPAVLASVAPLSIFAARCLLTVGWGFTGWFLHPVARQLGLGRVGAIAPALLLAGSLYASLPGYAYHWLVQPFLWAAVLAAFYGMNPPHPPHPTHPTRPGWRAWALSGLASGLAMLTLQTTGTTLVLTTLVWLGLDVWLGKTAWRVALGRLACFAGGMLVPMGVAGLCLASQHALGVAVDSIWRWPITHYKQRGGQNDVDYLMDLSDLLSTTKPGFRFSTWYLDAAFSIYVLLLPLGLGVLALARAAGLPFDDRPWTARRAGLAYLALVMLGSTAAMMRSRADIYHALYALPATLVLALGLARGWRDRWPGRGEALVRWLPTASLAAFGVACWLKFALAYHAWPEMKLRWTGPDQPLRDGAVMTYLRDAAKPGDRLAVFPYGGLYYLYGLPPATRYTYMLPPEEHFLDAADYDEFWREIEAGRTRFVLFAPIGTTGTPPRLPLAGYKLRRAFDITWNNQPHRALLYEREAGR